MPRIGVLSVVVLGLACLCVADSKVEEHMANLKKELATKTFDCTKYLAMSQNERHKFLMSGEFSGSVPTKGKIHTDTYYNSITDACEETMLKVTAEMVSCMAQNYMMLKELDRMQCTPMTIEGGSVQCKIRQLLLVDESAKPPKVKEWLGVPYAKPPVGDLRWAPPQRLDDKDPWPATAGLDYGHASTQMCTLPWSGCPCMDREPALNFLCTQPGRLGHCYRASYFQKIDGSGSDNCLNLNIWAPVDSDSKSNLPVMVVIHGGSFVVGTANVGPLSGDKLAVFGNMVVVSINYRLGAFGFLASKKHGLEGNYGFLDMIAALEWVQRNIHAFGGDPKRVTVKGQSAGAMSVAMLLVSPVVPKGLFHRAIMQSPPMSIPFHREQLPSLTIQQFFTALDCVDGDHAQQVACARTKTADEVGYAQKAANLGAFESGTAGLPDFLKKGDPFITSFALNFAPVIDGKVLDEQPFLKMLRNDYVNKVPMLLGYDDDEGAVFNYNYWLPYNKFPGVENNDLSDESFTWFGSSGFPFYMIMGFELGSMAPHIQTRYDVDWLGLDSVNNLHALEQLFTDVFFKCSIVRLARALDTSTDVAYLYKFTASMPIDMPWRDMCAQRACHGAEMGHMMGHSLERAYFTEMYTAARDFAKKRISSREAGRKKFGLSLGNYEGKDYPWAATAEYDEMENLGAQMLFYWTNFVNFGDPNGPSEGRNAVLERFASLLPEHMKTPQMPHWDRFSGPGSNSQALHFDVPTTGQTKDHDSNGVCKVLDETTGYFF